MAGKHLIIALPQTRLDRSSVSAFFAPVTSALGEPADGECFCTSYQSEDELWWPENGFIRYVLEHCSPSTC